MNVTDLLRQLDVWVDDHGRIGDTITLRTLERFAELVRAMVAYAVGDRQEVRHELKRNIRWLGKKRAHGRGRVTGIEVETIEQDYSMRKDGLATRWLPSKEGSRLVRPRPPYWNNCGRVRCGEIGESIGCAP